jgi:hypothetical protein
MKDSSSGSHLACRGRIIWQGHGGFSFVRQQAAKSPLSGGLFTGVKSFCSFNLRSTM